MWNREAPASLAGMPTCSPRLRPRPGLLRCPGCRQDLPGEAPVCCDGCGAGYHRGCWLALASACATLGCRRYGGRRWARRRARTEARRRWRRFARERAAEASLAGERWTPWAFLALALTPLTFFVGLPLGLSLPVGLLLGLAPVLLFALVRRRFGPRIPAPLPPAATGLGAFEAARCRPNALVGAMAGRGY